MGIELFFTPVDGATPFSLAGLRERLASAGLVAIEEDELGLPLLVLDGTESVLRPTIDEGVVTSIMVDWYSDDNPQTLERLGNTLESAGFESEDDGEEMQF